MKYRDIAARIEKEFGAEQLPSGWDERYAAKDLRRALEQAESDLDETARDVLRLELERLDEMQEAAQRLISTGSPQAIKTVLKIMERRAKYLGLDEPETFQVQTSTDALLKLLLRALEPYPEARQRVAEALAAMDE